MQDSIQVLLVEDNPGDAGLVREALREQSLVLFSVVWVKSLSAALESLQTALPDILLIDLGLPDSSGLETLHRLRESASDLPIVVMTGNADETVGMAAMQAGAQDYVVKGDNSFAILPRVLRYGLERHQNARRLKESEARFERLANNAPDIIFRFEVKPQMRLSYINPAVETITGFSPEECYADPQFIFRVIFPEDAFKMTELMQYQIVPEEPLLLRWVGKDDLVRWMETRMVPLKNEDGEVVAVEGITRDISKQRNMEESYQKLFTGMQDGFALHEIVLDAEGVPVDYCFLAANPAFEHMTGLKADDILGKTVLEVLPRTEREWIERYGKVALSGEPCTFELYAQEFDRWFQATAYCPGYLLFACTFMDITQRKKVEEKLRQSDDSLRALINAVGHTLFLMELDGTMIAANDTVAKRFGISAEKMIGMNAFSILTPELVEARRKYMEEAVTSKQRVRFEDERLGHWFDNIMYPVLNENGDVQRMAVYAMDITERKLMEANLRDSEEKFRAVFETANVGKSLTSVATSEVSVNKAFANMLGYTPEELTHITWQALTPPEEVESIQALLEPLLNGEKTSTRFEKRYIHKDGSYIWGDVSAALRRDSAGKPLHFITTIINITDRKKAEEALRETNDLFAQLMLHSPVYIYIKEVTPTRSVVLQASDNFQEMLGLKGREMVGKAMEELFPPDSAEKMTADDWSVVTRGEVLRLDEELNGRSYTTIKFPIPHGNKFLLAGYTIDITERKQAEVDLHLSEERFKTMFEQAPLGMALTDSLTGHYINVNARFAEIAGRSKEALMVIDWMQYTHPDDVQADLDQMALVNAGKINGFQMEKRIVHPDGRVVWVNMTIARVNVEDPDHARHLCMIEDITERRQAAENLRLSEERYRLISAVASDYMFASHLDADGSLVQDWTVGAIEGITGYGMAEYFASGGWRAHIHPDDLWIDDLDMDHLRQNQPVDSELRMLRKDGDVAWVHVSGMPVWDAEKQQLAGIYGSVLDITERKMAEIALQEGEERYRILHESAGVGIGYYTPQGIVISYNTIAAHNMNGKPEDFNGKSIDDLFPRAAAELYMSRISKAASLEIPQVYEDRVELPMGTQWFLSTFSRVLDSNGRVIGIQIVSTDTTEQKKTEQALLESEKKFRSLIETSPLAIYMSSGIEQKAEYVNAAFTTLFGYSLAEVPSVAEWWPLAYPDEQYRSRITQEWQRKVETAIRTHSEIEPMETLVTSKDGSKKYISWGYISTGTQNWSFGLDLTERKKAEEELRKKVNDLERFNLLMVDRELRMIELKKEINTLLQAAGLPGKYRIIE